MNIANININTTALIMAILVSGCGNKNIEAAKKSIEERLLDPSSVQYRNVKAYSENVVCGEVNGKNTMGGYVGYKPFIYKQDDINLDVSLTEIDAWCKNKS